MRFIAHTESLCGKTGRVTPATIEMDETGVYLIKQNAREEKHLLETDPKFFELSRACIPDRQFPLDNICLYVTATCNLLCPVCFEDASPKTADMPLSDIYVFLDSTKAKTIVLGGREPTCREDLPQIIRYAARKCKTVLTSNGLNLAKDGYVSMLKEAGLGRVAFSFNGFKDDIYEQMNGKPLLETKLRALDNLKRARMKTTLSITIARGVNDDQLVEMVKYCMGNRDFIDQLRIRAMTEIGRHIEASRQYTVSELLALLAESLDADPQGFMRQRALEDRIAELFGVSQQRCPS